MLGLGSDPNPTPNPTPTPNPDLRPIEQPAHVVQAEGGHVAQREQQQRELERHALVREIQGDLGRSREI